MAEPALASSRQATIEELKQSPEQECRIARQIAYSNTISANLAECRWFWFGSNPVPIRLQFGNSALIRRIKFSRPNAVSKVSGLDLFLVDHFWPGFWVCSWNGMPFHWDSTAPTVDPLVHWALLNERFELQQADGNKVTMHQHSSPSQKNNSREMPMSGR